MCGSEFLRVFPVVHILSILQFPRVAVLDPSVDVTAFNYFLHVC